MADGIVGPRISPIPVGSPRPSALLSFLTRRVGEAMRRDPAAVPAATPLVAAIGTLRRSNAPACLITDPAGRVVGLLDAELLMRDGMFQADPAMPVERVMHGPAALVEASDLLHEAAARLLRERRHALGVIGPDGRPLGLLTTEAAFAPLLDPLGGYLDQPGLHGWSERVALWSTLLADGQDELAVQATMSRLNERLIARTADTCVQAMAADGWGEPPVRFTVLLMGSGGRNESFLRPDQDNGFILADYPDAQHDRIDRWFIELASRFTRTLDEAGFPLCRGHVMATNPVWRKSISQWRAQIAGWAHRRSLQSVLWADIFLDFRAVGGAVELGNDLRAAILQVCTEQPLYLKQLSWEHVRHDVPLGLFGQLLGEPGAEHHDEIDLKLRATMPLVGLIRMLALRNNMTVTGTMERLNALISAGRISSGFGAMLAEDFTILTSLRIRQQLSDIDAARPVSNHLKLTGLSERERKRLVRLFRSIDTLRRVAAQEFGGRLG